MTSRNQQLEKTIFSEFEEEVRVISKKIFGKDDEVKAIYHYTSTYCAHQIIDKGEIWLSNIRYLNDPSELQSGLNILEEAAYKVAEYLSTTKSTRKNAFIQILMSHVTHIMLALTPKAHRIEEKKRLFEKWDAMGIPSNEDRVLLEDTINYSVFLASFSKKKDDLRQWVPYGDACKGVALGFSPNIAENIHYITEDSTYLVGCNYSSDELKLKYAIKMLTSFFKWLDKKLDKDLDEKLLDEINVGLTKIILHDLISCKSAEYKDEEEFRIFHIYGHSDDTKKENYPNFIVCNNLLRPYLRCRLNMDNLNEIRIGPTSDELNLDAFEVLKNKHSLTNCTVSKSPIPYRG